MDMSKSGITPSNTAQWHEQMFDNAHLGVLIVDAQRIILRVNQTFCRLFGYDHPDEIIGQSVHSLHVSDDTYREFGKMAFSNVMENKPLSVDYQDKKLGRKQPSFNRALTDFRGLLFDLIRPFGFAHIYE
ncbi:MAG: PAS domain-containing protein [Desulfuromusa sp.]|jgi:PAS domain S-box-containing protein|nr:PAS domain-containing protein [Desulfuromusa sp.]